MLQMGMDITVALRPKSGELRPQHNHPNTAATRENVLEYDPNDYTLVNIRTETVQYGKHNGQAAALIVLRCTVKFRPGHKRLRSFNVNIEFGTAECAGADASPSMPKIARLAPEERRGKIFTEERNAGLSGGVHLASGVPGLSSQVEGSHASKADREHEMRLSGWKKSSESATDNVAVWDCVEARKVAKGVLPGYRGAIVVYYHEGAKFQATFKLDVERGLWNAISKSFEWLSLFGKSADDPLIFDPAHPVGAQVDVADFKDVNLDDLVELEPIPVLPSGYN